MRCRIGTMPETPYVTYMAARRGRNGGVRKWGWRVTMVVRRPRKMIYLRGCGLSHGMGRHGIGEAYYPAIYTAELFLAPEGVI